MQLISTYGHEFTLLEMPYYGPIYEIICEIIQFGDKLHLTIRLVPKIPPESIISLQLQLSNCDANFFVNPRNKFEVFFSFQDWTKLRQMEVTAMTQFEQFLGNDVWCYENEQNISNFIQSQPITTFMHIDLDTANQLPQPVDVFDTGTIEDLQSIFSSSSTSHEVPQPDPADQYSELINTSSLPPIETVPSNCLTTSLPNEVQKEASLPILVKDFYELKVQEGDNSNCTIELVAKNESEILGNRLITTNPLGSLPTRNTIHLKNFRKSETVVVHATIANQVVEQNLSKVLAKLLYANYSTKGFPKLYYFFLNEKDFLKAVQNGSYKGYTSFLVKRNALPFKRLVESKDATRLKFDAPHKFKEESGYKLKFIWVQTIKCDEEKEYYLVDLGKDPADKIEMLHKLLIYLKIDWENFQDQKIKELLYLTPKKNCVKIA